MYDIIIVGAGTAGLSAAIYGVRAGKSVLILESTNYGGQIINTPHIENYPGINHISGFEFATNLYHQAIELGAEVKYERVTGIKSDADVKIVFTEVEEYQCKAVILATGAKNRKLNLENEEKFIGAGVSYCATCDGMFFKEKEVAVAGGGNTALEDALFLSDYCSKVYIIHRRNEFRGEQKRLQALKEKENVEFVLDVNITELNGENSLQSVTVKNKKNDEERKLEVSGIFIAIGQEPENQAFENVVNLDDKGYIKAGENCRTENPGIFTAGDCRTKEIRQLTTAASDGAVAALTACEYLNS